MSYDQVRAEAAVRELLEAVGEDPQREGLRETPQRMARAWAEMLSGMNEDPGHHLSKVFDIGHEEMVVCKNIPLYSVCEHHLLPFFGTAAIAYIPADGKVTGLSKLARVVEGYSRRLQVQERLTAQVADALVEYLQPRGVAVLIEAEHLCMTMRGVRKPGSHTLTHALRGWMRTNGDARAEAMRLLQ